MKTGIIIALKSEIKSVKYPKSVIGKCDVYQINKSLYLIFSGVGKANSAHATSILINKFGIKNIINLGSVGSIKKEIKVNDICLVSKCSYSDVDLTAFDYKIGQMAKEPVFFSCSALSKKLLSAFKSTISNKFLSNITLFTSDSFISKKTYKSFHLKNADIVDMEGTSISQVVSKYKDVSLSIIKVISDNVFDSKKNAIQWSNNLELVSKSINDLLNLIIKNV